MAVGQRCDILCVWTLRRTRVVSCLWARRRLSPSPAQQIRVSYATGLVSLSRSLSRSHSRSHWASYLASLEIAGRFYSRKGIPQTHLNAAHMPGFRRFVLIFFSIRSSLIRF